jgi:hypothetical protein
MRFGASGAHRQKSSPGFGIQAAADLAELDLDNASGLDDGDRWTRFLRCRRGVARDRVCVEARRCAAKPALSEAIVTNLLKMSEF